MACICFNRISKLSKQKLQAVEVFAKREGYAAFAWNGNPYIRVLADNVLIGASWIYKGSDDVNEFENVAKFDILVAKDYHKRGIGIKLFKKTLVGLYAFAKHENIPIRISVDNEVIANWLNTFGFMQVEPEYMIFDDHIDADGITYWEPA